MKQCNSDDHLISISFLHAHNSGVFAVYVEPVIALLGSTVQLRCTIDAHTPSNIFWSRTSEGSAIASINGRAYVGVLERNITWDDNGTWFCIANNNGGGNEEQFEITVVGKY